LKLIKSRKKIKTVVRGVNTKREGAKLKREKNTGRSRKVTRRSGKEEDSDRALLSRSAKVITKYIPLEEITACRHLSRG